MCKCKSYKKNDLPKTKAEKRVEKNIRKKSAFRTTMFNKSADLFTEKYHLN